MPSPRPCLTRVAQRRPADGLAVAALLALLAALLEAALWRAPAAQAAESQSMVLILSSLEPGTPDVATLIKGLREGLAETRPTQFNIFVEHLDRSTPTGIDDRTLQQLLGQKYRARSPDLVVALDTDAIEFAVRSRNALWRRAPILFSGEPRRAIERIPASNMTGVAAAMETNRTLTTALALFPGTKRLALINGASAAEATMKAEFLKDLALFTDRLELIDLSGAPLETVRERLAELPSDAIAYFLSFRTDGTGRGFLAHEVLDVLAPAASRPIFGTSETYFGHGIVGGWLIDYGQLGREVAAQALRILAGEPASNVPVERSSSIRPMFDWRALLRWGVKEDRLPAGSIVLFKQPTLWEQYRSLIFAAAGALLLQAGLIAFLLIERTGRQRAEAQALELSGQVLQAAEAERTRIAQELHDDVSQRLALLSIEIDQAGQAAPGPAGKGAGDFKRLSDKTREIAGDISSIARELHPATLKHLGLASAIRAFGSELEQRHGLEVLVSESMPLRSLPDAVATTLYRVVQEALHNIIKHSGASQATVTLTREGEDVSVRVADNGRGLPHDTATGGLGLLGMRERLRLVGGRLNVVSAPGAGTVIEARAPGGLQ